MSSDQKFAIAVFTLVVVGITAAFILNSRYDRDRQELSMSQYRLDYERLSGKVEAWREQGLIPVEGAK